MNRAQLEHAIRAACNVSDDTELFVFGSQAILGQYPEAQDALRKSIEVDMAPRNKPEAVDMIDGALGENSPFHKTHGFYVHGVPIESTKLPEGWQDRTIPVHDPMDENNTGYCIEAHDLAASKLMAFREKDTEFVRQLIINNMIDVNTLLHRLRVTEAERAVKERALLWTQRIAENH